jgi:FkbM family methyltransferase
MINLDFVEIGSCDHDTLLDGADDKVKGIIIEPIKIYLDRLPNYLNVIKLNVAVSPNNAEGVVDIFYVPPEIIENDPHYHLTLKGCNSIGKIHEEHIRWGLQNHVKKLQVPLIPLHKILEEHQVCKIGHLKIDIEGGDSELLKNFINYLESKTLEYYPEKITFETNELTPEHTINEVINIYSKMNYVVLERGFNTILKLNHI